MEAHFYFNLTQNPFIYKYKHIWLYQPGVPKSVHAYVHTQQQGGHGGFPAAGCLHETESASAGLRSRAPNRGGRAARCGSGLLRFKALMNTPDQGGSSNSKIYNFRMLSSCSSKATYLKQFEDIPILEVVELPKMGIPWARRSKRA